jgi:sulfite exporter TauE/SafE
MGAEFTLFGGVLLGLVSSLHCAAMCGPIAASILFASGGHQTQRERLTLLLSAQAGKALSYCIAAAALGSLGSGIYGLLNRGDEFRILQFVTAGWLVLVGAWVAGLIPVSLHQCCASTAARIAVTATGRVGSVALSAGPDVMRTHGPAFAFAYGIAWGAVPCGFVYAALMTSALTGSVTGAVSVMFGFALGTLPAVTVSALGLRSLKLTTASVNAKRLGGVLIAAFGLLGLLLTGPLGLTCL